MSSGLLEASVAGQPQSLTAHGQAQQAQTAPWVARGLALDLCVDMLSVLQKGGPACRGKTLQGLADQRPTLVPNRRARRAEGFVQGDALAVLLGDSGQQADLPGQSPEDHRRPGALAPRARARAPGGGGGAP